MVRKNPTYFGSLKDRKEDRLVNAMDFDEFFKETRETLKEIMSDPNYYTNKKLQAKVRMIRAGIVSAWEDKQFWDAVDANNGGEIKQMLAMFKDDTKDMIQKVEISGPDGDPIEQIGYLQKRDRELIMSIRGMLESDIRPPQKKLEMKDILKEENG